MTAAHCVEGVELGKSVVWAWTSGYLLAVERIDRHPTADLVVVRTARDSKASRLEPFEVADASGLSFGLPRLAARLSSCQSSLRGLPREVGDPSRAGSQAVVCAPGPVTIVSTTTCDATSTT